MTEWMDVRRDAGCNWFNSAPGGTPSVLRNGNGDAPQSEWVRAAKFCQAVADELQAEAEAEEAARETDLKLKVARICSEAHLMHHPAEAIIRAVREHDA